MIYLSNKEEINPQMEQFEHLLSASSIGELECEEIRKEISDRDISEERLTKLIEYLKMNQLDPITQGQNYSATDIQKRLDLIDNDDRK